jgi:hypothetical protein
MRTVGIGLAAVDVGPGGGVDDERGSEVVHDGGHRCLVADVELGAGQPDDVVVGVGVSQVQAELATGADDQDPHHAPRRRVAPAALSGRHQSGWSRYHAIVASSASSNP